MTRSQLFAALSVGIVVALVGVFGTIAGYPWLLASLGPTVALQANMPHTQVSRPWNVVVGHLLALGSGFAAVYATGAVHAPLFSASHSLSLLRVAAAAMAVTLAIGLEFICSAKHAAGAATALLIALGFIPPDAKGAAIVVCGVALVAVLGEGVRRIQLRLLRLS